MTAPRARASGGPDAKPLLTVTSSSTHRRPRTNPYLVQLLAALAPWVHVRFWSLRTALLARYDVVHLHWPEYHTMRHPPRSAGAPTPAGGGAAAVALDAVAHADRTHPAQPGSA